MRVAPLCVLALAACSSKPAPDAVPTEAALSAPAPAGASAAVYTCTDSTEIFALFATDSSGTSVVSLAIGEARLRLRQTTAASGAKYGDSTATFWNKGDEVTLDWNGVSRQCTAMPMGGGESAPATTSGGRPSAVHGTTPQ